MKAHSGQQFMNLSGIYPLLAMMSGLLAMQRGSDLVEVVDLVGAIYIVDLEHVSHFWKNWEDFEQLVSQRLLGDDANFGYINRALYLIKMELMLREREGLFIFGKLSSEFVEVISAAAEVARDQKRFSDDPSSKDILLCVCNYDAKMSKLLQESGLQITNLEASVLSRK